MAKKKEKYEEFEDPEQEVREGINIGLWILAIVITISVGLLVFNRWASPYQEETRNTTFMESTAHIQGTVRNIGNYRADYLKSDNKDHKAALVEMALAEAQEIDDEDLPEYLLEWVSELRTPRANE